MTDSQGLTCLITIHGMGFQHAPADGVPGYADGLHESLRESLPGLIGSDPVSEFGRGAGEGAIYVHSDWPPGSGKMNEGLKRLGVWPRDDVSHRTVDTTGVPLRDRDCPIAHVALVYAGLEEQQPHLGASIETLMKGIISHGNYASLPSLVGMGMMDLWAVVKQQRSGPQTLTPSLQVRGAVMTGGAVRAQQNPSSPLDVFRQLDHDVTTYVVRNDLRERVRTFLHDALLRLCFRDDVAHLVINSHSLGTVLAFDTIRTLPPIAAGKVRHLITAGSPLRKFTDLFYWGSDAVCLSQAPWTNFWDETDPVADPLGPSKGWRRGDPLPELSNELPLFTVTDPDTGVQEGVAVADVQTSNAAHGAGGGLAAHNYWDNQEEFVQPLASILAASTA